jgi:hypothetical protein
VGYDGHLLGLYLGGEGVSVDAFNNLTQWADLSGNGRHLTPCDALAPPCPSIGGYDQNVQAWSTDFTHYGISPAAPVAGGWLVSAGPGVVPVNASTVEFKLNGAIITTMTHRLGGSDYATARVSFRARKLAAVNQNLTFVTSGNTKVDGTTTAAVALNPALSTTFQSYSFMVTMTVASIGAGTTFGWRQSAFSANEQYEIVDFKVEDLSENHRCDNVIPCPDKAIAVPHFSYQFPYIEFGRSLSGTDNTKNTGLKSPGFPLKFPFTLYMAMCYGYETLNASYFDSLNTFRGAAVVCRDNVSGKIGFRNAAATDTVFSFPPFLRWHLATWVFRSPGGSHQVNRGLLIESVFNWGAITDLGGFVIGNTGGGITGSAGTWKCGGLILRQGDDDHTVRFKHQTFLSRRFGIVL